MLKNQKGQISTEYLILVGFITFAVLTVLALATIYAGEIRDKMAFHQLEKFADKVISSAELVFYAGTPSKTTITAYLPRGVEQIRVLSNEIVFNMSTGTGVSVISYSSGVPLTGDIPLGEGVKKLQINAQQNSASIGAV